GTQRGYDLRRPRSLPATRPAGSPSRSSGRSSDCLAKRDGDIELDRAWHHPSRASDAERYTVHLSVAGELDQPVGRRVQRHVQRQRCAGVRNDQLAVDPRPARILTGDRVRFIADLRVALNVEEASRAKMPVTNP